MAITADIFIRSPPPAVSPRSPSRPDGLSVSISSSGRGRSVVNYGSAAVVDPRTLEPVLDSPAEQFPLFPVGCCTPRGAPPWRWGVRPAAPLRGAVPAWRPAFPCLCDTNAGGVHAERRTILGLGVRPAAPLRGAVPAWRPAFPCRCDTNAGGVHAERRTILALGGPSRRPASRGCAGLEAGVPLPLRHQRWWGPRREENHPGAGGSVPPPRFAGLCRPGGRRSRAVAPCG